MARAKGSGKGGARRVGISRYPLEQERRRQKIVEKQKQDPARKPQQKRQTGKVARRIKEDPAPGLGRKSAKGGKAGGTRAGLRSRSRAV